MPSDKVGRLSQPSTCVALERFCRIAKDVTKNCGLAGVRFKLKSDTQQPRLSKTAVVSPEIDVLEVSGRVWSSREREGTCKLTVCASPQLPFGQ